MKISRMWAMPSADTFDVPPIGDFVNRYLRASRVSIDPFARNKRWATYTNDLNPDTLAEYHMDALDFLKMLRERGIVADLVIFDPPYSFNQAKVTYAMVGRDFVMDDAWTVGIWQEHKDVCYDLMMAGGVFLHFGWHSNGMGKGRGCEIEELLLIAHGRAYNDTICIAERKVAHQIEFAFEAA